MEKFWLLIFVSFFAMNSLDKAETVNLFDEIFGEGWWNNDKDEEWNKLTLEQNFHHQIDRQNTQIGQIEPNSTDQLGQIEPNSTDQNPPHKIFDEIFGEGWWNNDKAVEWNKLTHEQNVHHQIDRQNTQIGQIGPNSTDQLGQIKPNSTDQNPLLTESDRSDNAKNGEEQNEIIEEITLSENIAEDERKRKIVDKFQAIKDEFNQKGKYSTKERTQIEEKIAKHLKVSRKKIYKWKKEFGLSRKIQNFGNKKNERKVLIEQFDQLKAELMRAGFKNSYNHEIDKVVAKALGLNYVTISNWKRDLGQTKQNKYSDSEQKELMKRYYEIKGENTKIRDEDIAKMLKIGKTTLYKWKKQECRGKCSGN